MKIDLELTRELAQQYSSVDIEGFLNELVEWSDAEETGELEKNIIDVVIDVFIQNLGE